MVTEYKKYRCRHKLTKCDYSRTITELQLERELLSKLPELILNEIASCELKMEQQKVKPKYNLAALRARLRTLNESYMAGNKTDEEYINEGAEIKGLIAKAESEDQPIERNLEHLKHFVDPEFSKIYSTLKQEEKQWFWRSIIEEIILDDNRVDSVVFQY